MADTDIAAIGIAVDSTQVVSADAALAKLEQRAASVEASLAKLAATSAASFAKINPAMAGLAGPSAAGGSVANPFGPAWQQSVTGATSATMAFTQASASAAAANLRTASAATSAAGAVAGQARASVGAASGMNAMEKAADELRQRLDPAAAAHLRMSDAVAKYSAMAKAGLISQEEFIGGVKMEEQALKQATTAHHAHGEASYANRMQMMELAHVGRALFDEMAAGGNILRGLAMEGGRLQIALTSGEGGIGGLFGRIGSSLTAMLNPAVLAAAALTAVGAAAAVAFGSYESQGDKLTNALNGVGRRSGATVADLRGAALSGAAIGNLSTSEGIGLASGYAHAGVGADTTAGLVGLTRDYGRVTGTGTEDAGKALAGAFADPVKGLGDLDKQLGFVDDRLQQQVTDLERSGHMAQAQAVAMEALKRALENTTDTTWGFRKTLENVENWASNRFGQLGGAIASAVGADSPAEQLKRYQDLLPSTSRGLFAIGDRNTDTVQGKIDALQKVVAGQAEKAATDKRDADATALSRQAGDAVRTLLPDIARMTSARDTIEVLRQAMSDPQIRAHMTPDDARLTGRAYGDAVVLAANADPDRRRRQDYDIRIAGTGEVDVENKGLLDARKAELAVMRETGDVMRAATAAQMTLNEAIEAANVAAAERARTSKQNLDLIGLSPFERAMQEVRNKYDGPSGLIEQDRFDKGGTNVRNDDDIRKDLAGAGRVAASALEDVGPKVAAAGDHLAKAIEGVAAKVGAASPYGTLDHGAFGGGAGAPVPFFAAGAKAFDAAPTNVQAQALSASAQTGIPASIIAAIGQRENGYRLTGGTNIMGPNGRPASSAYGFGQLTDGAAADVSKMIPGFSKFDPSTAVLGSAEYLKILQGRFGDMQTALDHYGTGPGYGADILRRAGNGALAAAPTAQSPAEAAARPLTVGPSVAPLKPIASTASASDTAARGNEVAGVLKSYGDVPINEANKALAAQVAMLDAQKAAFGGSAAAVKAAADAQALWNKLAADGIVPAGSLTTATGALADKVRAYGSEAERVAQQKDDEDRREKGMIGAEDFGRSSVTDVLSSGITAAAHGKSFSKAASGALSSLGDKLINMGVGGLTGGLLGSSGQAGGGLFGGLFGNLISGLPHFATGTESAHGGMAEVGENGPELVRMPAGAQVMSNGEAKGFMGASRPSPNISIGGATFVASGEGAFSQRQMDTLAAQHAETQQKVAADLVRNFGQYQADAGQSG